MVQHIRNENATQYHETTRTSISTTIQAPEDRLLHLDKHLRRSVFFEHVARERYIDYESVFTHITGSSEVEEENDLQELITQLQDSLYLSTFKTKPPHILI